MKKILIDTNALISFVTDRNLDQQKIVAELIHNAADHKINIIILDNVISELVYVLNTLYNIENKIISQMLKDLDKTTGILIEPYFEINNITDLWPEKIKDYGDAILASYSKKIKSRFSLLIKNCGIS